jgi:hypothetical protein
MRILRKIRERINNGKIDERFEFVRFSIGTAKENPLLIINQYNKLIHELESEIKNIDTDQKVGEFILNFNPSSYYIENRDLRIKTNKIKFNYYNKEREYQYDIPITEIDGDTPIKNLHSLTFSFENIVNSLKRFELLMIKFKEKSEKLRKVSNEKETFLTFYGDRRMKLLNNLK